MYKTNFSGEIKLLINPIIRPGTWKIFRIVGHWLIRYDMISRFCHAFLVRSWINSQLTEAHEMNMISLTKTSTSQSE